MIRPSFQSKPLEIEVLYQQFISKIQIQVLHRYRGFSFFIEKNETKILDKPNRSACFVTSPLKQSSVDILS